MEFKKVKKNLSVTQQRQYRNLSKRAKKLFAKIMSGSPQTFSKYHGKPTMMELEKSGLVKLAGRAIVMESCYVPIGFQISGKETMPEFMNLPESESDNKNSIYKR